MAFIRVDNVVINTDYIAAIVFDQDAYAEVDRIALLMAVPHGARIQHQAGASGNSQSSEWLEFTGETARQLRDYFTSFNHVLDLRREFPIESCESQVSLTQQRSPWNFTDTYIGR